jgi:hypothetical protein
MNFNSVLKIITGGACAIFLLFLAIGLLMGKQDLASIGMIGLFLFGILLGLLFVKRVV